MAFTDNIKEITPAITQLKSNTPVIVIDGKIYVAGIGGNFIPGNAAASQSGTANIAAGYITISDSVITVHNVTDGTTSTTDKLYIADTGVEEPEYQSGGGTAPVQEFKVYKCTAVSDSAWTGYQYDIDTPGLDAVQSTMQFKAATPTVGSYYNENATIQVKPYSTRSDLVVYVPMVKNSADDQIGTTNGKSVVYTTIDGLDCCLFEGTANYYISLAYRGITGNDPWSWSIWCKKRGPTQNNQMVFQLGDYQTLQTTGLQILAQGDIYYFQQSGVTISSSYDVYKWHNLSATYDGAIYRLYIDGQSVGQTQIQYQIQYKDGAYGFQIGRSTASTYWIPFNGYARDLKIYNTVLTPQQIAAEYNRLSSKIINS